jgi:hypothetical protein
MRRTWREYRRVRLEERPRRLARPAAHPCGHHGGSVRDCYIEDMRVLAFFYDATRARTAVAKRGECANAHAGTSRISQQTVMEAE